MNEQIKNDKDVNFLERPATNPDRPWELSAEDQNFFDRKIKALAYFKGKLDTGKEQSSKFSQGAVANLDRRVGELGTASPEEIVVIKQRLNDLERQKQEVIKSGESQVEKIADTEYTDFEEVETTDSPKIQKQPDETENIKPKDETVKAETDTKKEIENSPEKLEEKPLEPGDEVFSDGNFYKIYNIHTPTAEEEQEIWENGKFKRDKEFNETAGLLPYKEGSDRSFQERKLFEEQKKKELKERGPIITAIIKGGEEKIELDVRNAIKIKTPEQREKIVKMQKEADKAESRAANYMGMGVTKKMVDKITGQPGKF